MLRKAFHAAVAYPWKEKAKRLILDTPIEVGIGALLLGGACGLASFNHENAKQGQIPLAFSEISEIERAAAYNGHPVPPMTRYYASLNDTLMQVFEANNISYTMWGASHRHFATELEYKVDRAYRIHTQLSDYAARMPSYAQQARASIAPMTLAARDLQPVIAALDRAWDDDHDDVYRTEYYTEEVCSGTGETRSCTMETRSRQVYDHTIHTYTYDRQQGELAARLLRDFAQKHPTLDVGERLMMAARTNADNEQAMYDSRRRLPDFKGLQDKDYLQLANTWATGSTYVTLTPGIWHGHAQLARLTPQWTAAAPRGKSTRYTTGRSSDDGPKEFQVAEAALDYAVTVARDIGRIDSGMAQAHHGVPALHQKILDYVAVMLDRKEGDAGTLKREIMKDARDLYAANYAGGFDTQPSKWGMVVLWAVTGLLAGGALGFGVDRVIDRLYRSRGRLRPVPPWQRNSKTRIIV